MKIAVVGAGIAGLSLAWALTGLGARVALFDQGPIPNPRSSSFDQHRVTRHTYGTLSGYSALMPAAFAAYDRLWADLGANHYHRTNLVYVGPPAPDWVESTVRDLGKAGIAFRELDAGEIATRLPMLRRERTGRAFEAEGAGMLFASRIVTDLARWLAEAGVELHPHSHVTAVDAEAGSLVANGRRYDADALVVAAGAWLPDLRPDLAPRLRPSRQTLLYLQPPDDVLAAWAAAPIFAVQGDGRDAYIVPPRDGTGMKIGDHTFTRRGHGDDDRIARDDDIAPVREAAAETFADFHRYRITEAKVCYYTVAADERFVVEPLGPAGWLLSACSGHGFKLAPLIASGLAEAITGRRPPAEVTAWAAGRG